MDRRWIIKSTDNELVISQLSRELNINPILAGILFQRGIDTFDKAKNFFRPNLSQLHDPFLMKDMDAAVNRLAAALANKEKIMVYGDYDVDGTTSVAMVYSFLKPIVDHVDFYIPDRDSEGYGISLKGIDFAYRNNISLIIALDCGIKDVKKIEYAASKNIDFIICDHHTPGEEIPAASAVLDPKRSDCKYPFKELSGCGVGFKFLQGFCINQKIDFSDIEKYLDLVAVSISSDIVPIIDENRILTYFGLKRLNENPGIGLKAIINSCGFESNVPITVNDVVFRIGPRINAAGRIDYGKKAVELLVSSNLIEAEEYSYRINKFNNTRKVLDSTITEEIIKEIRSKIDLQNRKTTVVYNPAWHKGVLGIVASRLTEYYYRPTIVLTESNGFATGSARSVDGFDLYKAIAHCSDLLENFGGHMYAAGLTLKPENVPALKERFEEYVLKNMDPELSQPKIEIDAQISLNEITPSFYSILKQFEPFGPENMRPVFLTENVSDKGYGKKVGTQKEHLKLDIIENGSYENAFPSIAFQMSKHFPVVSGTKPFSICYSVDENTFMGKTRLQLVIKDIKS